MYQFETGSISTNHGQIINSAKVGIVLLIDWFVLIIKYHALIVCSLQLDFQCLINIRIKSIIEYHKKEHSLHTFASLKLSTKR